MFILYLQKTLRHQDVTLMRQFITMNDTIRSISQDQKSEKTRKKRLRNRTLIIPANALPQTMPSWQIPLIRQQSVPRFCDVIPEVRERTWSCSSGGMHHIILFLLNANVLVQMNKVLNFITKYVGIFSTNYSYFSLF